MGGELEGRYPPPALGSAVHKFRGMSGFHINAVPLRHPVVLAARRSQFLERKDSSSDEVSAIIIHETTNV